MYRWCSYCQKFLGEKAPFKDYRLSHGICAKCKITFQTSDDSADRAKPLINFFNSLRQNMLTRNIPSPELLLQNAAQLGITPIDLMTGMIQPLLYEIAALQSVKKSTITHEHEFSNLVDGLFHAIQKQKNRQNSKKIPSDVLLSCADGNYHYFGIKLMHEIIELQGYVVSSLFPSCPFEEVIQTANELQACVIGFSVATNEQLNQTLHNWDTFKQEKQSLLKMMIGGHALPDSQNLPQDCYVHSGNLNDLYSFLENAIKRKAA